MATLEELVQLTRRLGEPELDLCILAEGNTSAQADEESFWVKASGFGFHRITEQGFVQVRFAPILQALDGAELDDQQVRELLKASRSDPSGSLLPSVETFMHAYLLRLPDVEYVGHCHPTPLLTLLCMEGIEEYAEERMFPDEIAFCGPATCFVEYVDPGLSLARVLRQRVREFIRKHEVAPKIIWLQNHGLIALGQTPKEVESAILMAVKAARVLLGLLSTGTIPHFLTPEQVRRIHTRPDEHYRQRLLWEVEKTKSS